MGAREKIGMNPMVATVLAIVILVSAGVYILMRPAHNGSPFGDVKFPTKSYFSDDDGATWFVDDAGKIPPFDHNGKQAFRVKLFRCGDGKPFVQRLESYGDDAKQKINDRLKAQHLPPNAFETVLGAEGLQVKKPGDKDWVSVIPKNTKIWSEIMDAKCPDGNGIPTLVSPEDNVQP